VTVASGLDNPRQLSFRRDGSLFVVEAGAGGAGPCFTGPEGETCFGRSGAVTRVWRGHQVRVLHRLPSVAAEDGSGAIGPTDVVPLAAGRFALTIGLGGDPALRDGLPRAGKLLATLVRADNRGPGQRLRVIRDLGAFEARVNPHPTDVDTNPTALVKAGKGWVVADAGANALLRVHRRGTKVLAVFPDRAVGTSPEFQAVPTSVAKGPDGAYYVSQLTGFPFLPGAANIWRVVPGHEPTVYASGLTNVTDLAWHHGSLYAVQISDAGLGSGGPPVGSLRMVVAGADEHPAVASGLFAPYGVALRGHRAYVSVCAVCADTGEVVRIALP
jgi:glucose/arabinose dehydrogenase